MANIKITALPAYADPVSTDVLPIVDVGADVTKKVSIQDLLENAGSGTAAAPGIAFDGDSDTGIYRPGADQVAISTSGTERMRIDSSGRLLVNGTSASGNNKLQVIDSDALIYGVTVGLGGGAKSTNTAVGSNALAANVTGASNAAYGYRALYLNTIGSNNTAIGVQALYVNTSGSSNTAIGSAALYANAGGTNTAIGGRALYANTNGSKNIGIGYKAGEAITTGSNNTIIGEIPGTATLSNTVIIGAGTTERLRIDSSGRLLVGTSSQSGGALLQVDGDRVRISTAKTPASASDTGTTGEVCWDANYIYVCTATDTWKRAALSTW